MLVQPRGLLCHPQPPALIGQPWCTRSPRRITLLFHTAGTCGACHDYLHRRAAHHQVNMRKHRRARRAAPPHQQQNAIAAWARCVRHTPHRRLSTQLRVWTDTDLSSALALKLRQKMVISDQEWSPRTKSKKFQANNLWNLRFFENLGYPQQDLTTVIDNQTLVVWSEDFIWGITLAGPSTLTFTSIFTTILLPGVSFSWYQLQALQMCRSVKKALEVGLFSQLLKRMMGYWHIRDLRGCQIYWSLESNYLPKQRNRVTGPPATWTRTQCWHKYTPFYHSESAICAGSRVVKRRILMPSKL